MNNIENNHTILISGKSSTGKTYCLKNLANPEGVIYCNAEGKRAPFKHKFKEFRVSSPGQIYDIFDESAKHSQFHTIVIDSLTFLMDMYETMIVLKASNPLKEWGKYSQYFKDLMKDYVAPSNKNIIFLAHTGDDYNDKEMRVETSVKVKGQLKDRGIEAFFTTVISTKKVSLRDLEGIQNPLLNITEREKNLGFKYVFQTDITSDTRGERIRNPDEMWLPEELYIDNNAQSVIDKLHDYYKEEN